MSLSLRQFMTCTSSTSALCCRIFIRSSQRVGAFTCAHCELVPYSCLKMKRGGEHTACLASFDAISLRDAHLQLSLRDIHDVADEHHISCDYSTLERAVAKVNTLCIQHGYSVFLTPSHCEMPHCCILTARSSCTLRSTCHCGMAHCIHFL